MAARDEKNRKRNQSGSYYTYGNVAYELQPYQVVYINVPKQSYTVQHDTEETTAETSLMDKILDFFKKD